MILYSVERRDAHRAAQQDEYYSEESRSFLCFPQKANFQFVCAKKNKRMSTTSTATIRFAARINVMLRSTRVALISLISSAPPSLLQQNDEENGESLFECTKFRRMQQLRYR